ncbi:hypothetical protein Trydic_g16664 [Trypoxylus dichotomus]
MKEAPRQDAFQNPKVAETRGSKLLSGIVTEALHVLALTPPIDLLVQKRSEIEQGSDSSRENIHNIMLDGLQNRWSSDIRRAAWTKRLLRDRRPCVERKHGQASERQQAEGIIGRVTPTTIVASTLKNEGIWKAVETMVRKIMGKKESHKRSRHRANMQSELRME